MIDFGDYIYYKIMTQSNIGVRRETKKWEELLYSLIESNNHAPLTIVITKLRVV